jgi:hypothetical protein
MRTMLKVQVPVDRGSETIKDGTFPKVIQALLDDVHPEAVYFGPESGQRTCYIVFDLSDSADLPRIAEPLFMQLSATVEAMPVMNLQDLQGGLARLPST